MSQYLIIFIGGGLGSLCRFSLSRYNQLHDLLPYGTMAANFLSCIVLGFITAHLAEKTGEVHISLKPLLAIGFCGGFSTFSTFSLETFELLKRGETSYAFFNVTISVFICLVALYLGFALYKIFVSQ